MHILKKSFLAISLCMAMGTVYADTDTNSNQTIEYHQIDATTQNEISFESYAFSEPVVFTEMTKAEEEETQGARFGFIGRFLEGFIFGGLEYTVSPKDSFTAKGLVTACVVSGITNTYVGPYENWISSSRPFFYDMKARTMIINAAGAHIGGRIGDRFSTLD